jgi:hypothetical protein
VLQTPDRALIEPLTSQEARPVSDRIDPPIHPDRRGPWPQVTDLARLYDHGQPWCVNAAGHPDPNGGYPDPARHLPWQECRGREVFVDGPRRELDGEPVEVSVYNAAAFRFGQPRDDTPPAPPRVVLEAWTADEPAAHRLSLTPGQALHLARILVHCADDLTFVQRPA